MWWSSFKFRKTETSGLTIVLTTTTIWTTWIWSTFITFGNFKKKEKLRSLISGDIFREYLLQFLNGFPVKPLGQKQIGLPRSNSHKALIPQGFGSHGFVGGLHPIFGSPLYPGEHLQIAL